MSSEPQQLSFSANLVFQFAEDGFLARFGRAAAAGFGAVEYMFPYEFDSRDLVAALRRNDLRQDLFNLPAGDFSAGERGIAVDPARRSEFAEGVELAIRYANELGCRKINCLVGNEPPDVPLGSQHRTLVDNLRLAADRFRTAGILLLIEMLNPAENPTYYLRSMSRVHRVLDDVGAPELKVQLDIYHLQRTQGELVPTIETLGGRIGHVQIADAPGRQEPGTGEINYRFVLQALASSGYAGCIGLEYRPSSRSEECFGWIDAFGYRIGANPRR